MAIDDRVPALLGDAVTAGWDDDEVLTAIIEVADKISLATQSDVRTHIATVLINLIKKNDV